MQSVVLNVAENTFVSSAQPNNNFSFYPLLYTGTDIDFQSCVSFLKFDLSSLPVSSVDSAQLQLAVIVKAGTTPSPVDVNIVTSPLDTSTVTYNTQPSFVASLARIDVATSDLYTTMQIDVTELVNQWLVGTHANEGIALSNSDGITAVQFASDKIVYEPYFPKLVVAYSATPLESSGPYGYIYNTGNQSISPEDVIPFSSNGKMFGVTHTTGTGTIAIDTPGTYAVWFTITGSTSNQFALFQNTSIVPGSIYGTGYSSNSNHSGMVIINAANGDVLTVKNHTSNAPVELNNTVGGIQINTSAAILLLKVGPYTPDDSMLTAVNTSNI